jgi:hypothetical protein
LELTFLDMGMIIGLAALTRVALGTVSRDERSAQAIAKLAVFVTSWLEIFWSEIDTNDFGIRALWVEQIFVGTGRCHRFVIITGHCSGSC